MAQASQNTFLSCKKLKFRSSRKFFTQIRTACPGLVRFCNIPSPTTHVLIAEKENFFFPFVYCGHRDLWPIYRNALVTKHCTRRYSPTFKTGVNRAISVCVVLPIRSPRKSRLDPNVAKKAAGEQFLRERTAEAPRQGFTQDAEHSSNSLPKPQGNR